MDYKKIASDIIRKEASLKDDLLSIFQKAKIKIPSKEEARKILKDNFYDIEDSIKLLKNINKLKSIVKKSNSDVVAFKFPSKLFKNILILSAIFAVLEQSVPTQTKEIENQLEEVILVDLDYLGTVDASKFKDLLKGFNRSEVLPILVSRKLKENPDYFNYRGTKIPSGLTSGNIRFGLNNRGDLVFEPGELANFSGTVHIYKSK